MVDLGFYTWRETTIRLLGIDTPEVRTKDLAEKERGIAAKDRLIQLLQTNNGEFYIQSRELDSFGRSLGTLYVTGLPESVNQTMLNEGHATTYIL
jgi:endonuclease YncB( thermonuclease family)